LSEGAYVEQETPQWGEAEGNTEQSFRIKICRRSQSVNGAYWLGKSGTGLENSGTGLENSGTGTLVDGYLISDK
jgi:hypothetical protein